MNPTRIQLRYDTIAAWESTGTLNIGELGIAQKVDGSVEARVGTENNQLWANAKPLSISQDELGLNIEEIGRVFLTLNLGDFDELIFSDCIVQATVSWENNSTGDNYPKQSFPNDNCVPREVEDVIFRPFTVIQEGNNLVGYQSSAGLNEIFGFSHNLLGNAFRCSELQDTSGAISRVYPLRPIAADGAKLIWLKDVEVWKFFNNGVAYIEFQTLVDGWFPDFILDFSCGGLCKQDNTCICPSVGGNPGYFSCICEATNECMCGQLCTGSFLIDDAVSDTDFDPEEYGVIDYFDYGTDNQKIYVNIPYHIPREVKISGYINDKTIPTYDKEKKYWVNKYGPTFDELEEGITYWDVQENKWKITDTLEGGTY